MLVSGKNDVKKGKDEQAGKGLDGEDDSEDDKDDRVDAELEAVGIALAKNYECLRDQENDTPKKCKCLQNCILR